MPRSNSQGFPKIRYRESLNQNLGPRHPSMDVTLIVPVHSQNPESVETLIQAVASLQISNLQAELIIVADSCAASVIKRIKVLSNGLNGWTGITIVEVPFRNPDKSRQIAYKRAGGKYVAFLDDDTLPNPGWLMSGLLYLRTNGAVTGPVRHRNNLMGSLVAVMDFGEFQQRDIPVFISNAPGCNLIFEKKLINSYPFLLCRYGGDRVLAAQLAAVLNGKILYHPSLEINHHPDLTPAAVWRREFRYGSVAFAVRKNNPLIPWDFLTRTGGLAPFLLVLGRLVMDLKRVLTGDQPCLRKLLMLPVLLFFRIPYFLGIIRSYVTNAEF